MQTLSPASNLVTRTTVWVAYKGVKMLTRNGEPVVGSAAFVAAIARCERLLPSIQ